MGGKQCCFPFGFCFLDTLGIFLETALQQFCLKEIVIQDHHSVFDSRKKCSWSVKSSTVPDLQLLYLTTISLSGAA
ncbi:hypothetical protein FKM82_012820 [Ascaphus truei]